MHVYKMFIPPSCPSNFISVLIFQVSIAGFYYFFDNVLTLLIQVVMFEFIKKLLKDL